MKIISLGWLKTRIFGAKQNNASVELGRKVRSFAAGLSSRLTSSWKAFNQSIDSGLLRTLDAMRARSNDLAKNNGYIKKWLEMVADNVIGQKGFTLRVLSLNDDGTKDVVANKALETAFAKWAKVGNCDVTEQYSLIELCRLAIVCVARDGECLIRRVRGPDVNQFGYALQLLDIQRLMVNYNLNKGATSIRMGVEIDSRGKPIYYHLRTQHPGDALPSVVNGENVFIEAVPASEIFHLFIHDYPEQRRGIPWAHAVMQTIKMLDGYIEAALVAARTGAAKMGFFSSPDGDASPLADDEDEGDFVTSAEPGTFQVLPKGYDLKEWNPNYPHENHDAFMKSGLRQLAVGLNVPYNSLASDLEGVSYSSIRSGTLEERNHWMSIQGWMIRHFMERIYVDWLEMALLKGVVTFPGGQPLPAAKLEKYSAHKWHGLRWAWVDPLNEVNANIAAVEGGLKSRTRIVAEMGDDIESVLEEIAAEEAMAKEKGISIKKVVPSPAAPPAQPQPQPEEKTKKKTSDI